jgi:hypothetical protein
VSDGRALGRIGVAILALLFACADAPAPDTAPPAGQGDDLPGTELPPVAPVAPAIIHSPSSVPRPVPSTPARAPTPVPVFNAAPAPSYAPGPPQGPVTNYGTGGMQAPPGSAPNPPYPAGGLMH